MHSIVAIETLEQEFQWKAFGECVDIFFAEFSGLLRDAAGNITFEATAENFLKIDEYQGVFKLFLTEEDMEVARRNGGRLSFEIYGKLPHLNRSLICKGDIRKE